MTNDPIVDEIRAIREAIAKECNYDVRLITQRARERIQASGAKVVSFTSPIREDVSVTTHIGNDDAEFEEK